MPVQRVAIAVLFALVLGVPFLLRPASVAERDLGPDATLVIITPHVTQLRDEFEHGFVAWHERTFGTPVKIVWNIPGGTSEIIKQLQAKYNAALRTGEIRPDGSCDPGTIPIDLVFGGGSFDHGRLKSGDGVEIEVPDPDQPGEKKRVKMSMSVPAGFTQAQLDAWFGENSVGVQKLYDPEQYWIGTALSGFGIVYNREILASLAVPDPASFEDLCRPELFGWVALADPRQSGSVTTTLDAILSAYGWDKGWRILRDMTANARYFTNSSTKPPIDVAQGEAAVGLAIDFYGRNQSQSILRPGQDPTTSRVGYVDPKGAVSIDADPVSVLRGGPNPALAKKFIEYCLSDEGQALWNFRPRNRPAAVGDTTIVGETGVPLGPAEYALRRMPVRRLMYEKYSEHLMDPVNPFELASKTKPAGWRSGIGIMMGAFAIDTAEDQRAAMAALRRARATPGFPAGTLDLLERTYYSWPTLTTESGVSLEFNEKNFPVFKEHWRDPERAALARAEYTAFFREKYRLVVSIAGGGTTAEPAVSAGR